MAANPTLLSMPIAENGTKNTIPENQATPGNGLMSQSTGFPAECSLPLGSGGVAPDRADFNGAFNLLGGIAFMAQKGFTFNYDATQDYYAGCVVIDGGNRYLCIADMAAGTVAPSADTTHDYWIFYPVGVINKRDVVTTSGTYTAPVTGWYKITIKGGGGGGSGAFYRSGGASGGMGGGEGGTSIGFEHMTAGDTATVVIGGGGSGGSGLATTITNACNGLSGGNSTVTVNGNTYTGGGGAGGQYNGNSVNIGIGGTGDIPGASGGISGMQYINGSDFRAMGGEGGGNGAGDANNTASFGGGGAGGVCNSYNNNTNGYAGGNGVAWFEYFDPSL